MRYLLEMGACSLDVTTEADADEMDGAFTAVCNDTGERLQINGWLIDEITAV